MSKLMDFLEKVEAELRKKPAKNKFDTDYQNDALILCFKSKKQGTCHCINSMQVYIHPDMRADHHMETEEIWVGYDEGGYPWSDHMGGRSIDCTGMKSADAIKKIADQVYEDHKDLFNSEKD